MSRTEDKRRHPRVVRRLRVRSDHRDELELETIDVSAGGVSCTSPAFLAPMTKVVLSLVLPPNQNDSPNHEHVVHSEAVVVRTEPQNGTRSNEGPFRVAFFFSRMEEEDRQKLQEFLKSWNGAAEGSDH